MPDTGTPAVPQVVKSSDRAILLIVTEEDGDENYYLKFESHFSWPGGRSGPTVGVGYDCGYSTAEQIDKDWYPYIGSARTSMLANAAGLKGGIAQQWVSHHRMSVSISWHEALAQFKGHELPKWEQIVQLYLPNTEMLSGDSFGALVSLTYNRGPSFDLPGGRFVEMRSIKSLMAEKAFDLIPNQVLEMRRLWPTAAGLRNRRLHEALLFRDGLHTTPAITPSAQPAVGVQGPLMKGLIV